jgi:hypothetical protein
MSLSPVEQHLLDLCAIPSLTGEEVPSAIGSRPSYGRCWGRGRWPETATASW